MFSNYEESKPSCYMQSYQRGAMAYRNRQAQAIALVMPQSRRAMAQIATPSFSFFLSSLISLLIISLVIVRLVLILLGL
jgi:hypothetical protein